MKRLLLSLTLLAAAIGGGSAQNLLLDDPDNAPYFGARIGVDITSTPAPTVITTMEPVSR